MGVLAVTAKADEWDRKTSITANQAFEVEGIVLPAGSYVFKLVNLPFESHLVRIFNADENQVIATVFATPIYRFVAADNSEFSFYKSESGQPPALHTWFYPGDATGFEFKASSGAAAVQAARGASATATN